MNFSCLDIRVGRIVDVEIVNDSEKLYRSDIDVGDDEPRQIVSGLRPYYDLDDMMNRSCIVACNLPKAKVAGISSFGMILCGVDSNETLVEILDPPPLSSIGERVFCNSEEEEKEEAWKPNRIKKKKAWKILSQDLKLVDGTAMFRDVPIEPLSGGLCTTSTLMSGYVC